MPSERRQQPVTINFGDNGLGLLESHHAEGFSMPWRRDNFPKILVIVGGEGTLHRHEGDWPLVSPMVVVVPRRAEHRLEDRPGHPMSLYGICLRRPGFPSRSLIEQACGVWRRLAAPSLTRRIENLLREILLESRANRDHAEDLQLGLVTRILVLLARLPNDDPPPGALTSQQRVAAYVAGLTTEFWKQRSIEDVARSLGLSRRRFTQLFREITGESWLVHLTRLRMQHAAELLRETNLPVRSVAFECGFTELTHFYRVFRSEFGESPAAWRDEALT